MENIRKKKEKEDMKEDNQKGVTLVALVITIIILIILAGISINTLVGENGVITKAQQAKENTILAQEEEAKQLNQLYSQLNYTGGNTGNVDGDAVDKLLNFKKVIAIAITNEGVTTQETDSAETMASHIEKILQERTKGATATSEDIVEGKTAWVNGKEVLGTKKETIGYLEEGEFSVTLGPGQVKQNIVTTFKNVYSAPPLVEVTATITSGDFAPYINMIRVSENNWNTHLWNGSGTSTGTVKIKWVAYQK